jgi:hypothetical protein
MGILSSFLNFICTELNPFLPLWAEFDLSDFNVLYLEIYEADPCWIFTQPILYFLQPNLFLSKL